eukprot:scaffold4095_cov117-Cylindrotheca_fusiformis.AAC.1
MSWEGCWAKVARYCSSLGMRNGGSREARPTLFRSGSNRPRAPRIIGLGGIYDDVGTKGYSYRRAKGTKFISSWDRVNWTTASMAAFQAPSI